LYGGYGSKASLERISALWLQRKKKVGEVIVDVLEEAGLKNCYGIVGDTLNTFATSPTFNLVGTTLARDYTHFVDSLSGDYER
jgi:hypothetical protein